MEWRYQGDTKDYYIILQKVFWPRYQAIRRFIETFVKVLCRLCCTPRIFYRLVWRSQLPA